jgi:hypothetical protein
MTGREGMSAASPSRRAESAQPRGIMMHLNLGNDREE